MSAVEFVVYGHPQTAGSKRAFAIRRNGVPTGRVAVADDNARTKSWQASVAQAGADASDLCLAGPLYLVATFYLHRPRSHFRTGANANLLSDRAPLCPASRPDLLKLTRAIEDALTSVLWHDDSQICSERLVKRYAWQGEPERVEIAVGPLPEPHGVAAALHRDRTSVIGV